MHIIKKLKIINKNKYNIMDNRNERLLKQNVLEKQN